MNKRYRFFQAWFMAFFSPALYRDAAKNWRGTGFCYLFILLAVCWIPLTYQINRHYVAFQNAVLPELSQAVPDMHLDKGKLTVNKSMPYQIQDSVTKKPIIIIDTTGKVTSLKDKPDTIVLLTQQNMMIKTDGQETRVIDFPSDADWAVNAKTIEHWGEKVGDVLIVAFYPLALIISWLYRMVQAIFYAAIGTLIFAALLKVRLEYKSILRLSAVAVTPAIIISTLLCALNVMIPHALLLYFLLTMVYLFLAIYANREQ